MTQALPTACSKKVMPLSMFENKMNVLGPIRL